MLVEAAAGNGMTALALTDTHLAGMVAFYDACLAAGVKPILGLEFISAAPAEIDGAAGGPLVLLATGLAGWSNLCRLSSAVHSASGGVPTAGLPIEIPAEHSQDLLCLTGGVRSLLDRWIGQDRLLNQTSLLLRLASLRNRL